MTLVRKLRLVVLIGLAAAAVAVPAAGAETTGAPASSKLVQIGGELVAPDQASVLQARLGAAETSGSKLVQIGGHLVAPSQASALQARLGAAETSGSKLVQIGGHLVAPSQVSTFQAHAGAARTTTESAGDGGFDWSAKTTGLSLLGALALFAGVLAVLWRRGRLTTA